LIRRTNHTSSPSGDEKMLSLFVAGCFFLSGMASLVYEVIWVRLIETLIGGAPFAVATVLCLFMAYEVFWTHLLGPVSGSTSYCFTLVVAAFIVGLAVGSLLFARLADHGRHPLLWLAGTQTAAFITALGVSHILGNGQFYLARLDHAVQVYLLHPASVQTIVLFLLILVPTLFLGAAFPLVNRLCIRTLDNTGRSVGTAYALNTVAGLLGSFVAGFVLIPCLGEMNGLRLVLSIQFLAAGFALLDISRREKRDKRLRLAVVGLMGVGLLLVANYPSLRTDLLFRTG